MGILSQVSKNNSQRKQINFLWLLSIVGVAGGITAYFIQRSKTKKAGKTNASLTVANVLLQNRVFIKDEEISKLREEINQLTPNKEPTTISSPSAEDHSGKTHDNAQPQTGGIDNQIL